MNTEQLTQIIAQFAEEFPVEVSKNLSGVEILVCETPEIATAELNELLDTDDGAAATEALPADCKGVFIGEPMEAEDEDQESEFETVELPDGAIALIACNIKDAEEAVLVLLHEIGHALSMDEDEVKALGLGVSPSTSGEGAPDVSSKDSNPV